MKELTQSFRTACFMILLGICVSPVWSLQGSHAVTLTLDPGTVVLINRTEPSASECEACVGEDRERTCQPSTVLGDAGKFKVTFTCTQPWDVFTVEIVKKLECKTKPCKHAVMPTDFQPLFEFNRTFHWSLTAPVRMTFHVDVSAVGLTQVGPWETCPDGHTYNLVALDMTKNVHLGTFCAKGTITGVQILYGGKVALTVPGRRKLEPHAFDVFWGEDIKSLAGVSVKLPRGQSSQEFFSPNYPSSFPDDDLMTWNFDIPRNHDTTVKFLQYKEPRCRKKVPGVEYWHNNVTVLKRLTDEQLKDKQGSFALSLRNCEMDVARTRAESLGLALHFTVSTIRTVKEVECNIDLSRENSLSLQIAKKSTDSACKLKLNGVSQERIDVPPGKKSVVSFKDCPEEDMLLTVNKTIGCQRLQDCPSRVPLTVPALERCLPESLEMVHWNLQAPNHGTVELWAFASTLRQSLPGQECNGSVEFSVTESDGVDIGRFCPNGIISKMQVHGNVTVSASPRNGLHWPETVQTFFKVSFTKEIRETYMFFISPVKGETSLLASPGWPGGMKAYATASWITTFPAQLVAHLTFTKITQPKCSNRHTGIQVQTLGSEEEMYSRREDEQGDSEIVVHENFYLNMSNCLPEEGSFRVMGEITLTKRRRIILPITLAVVGALLLVMIIALVAVCVVIRKKKKEMAHQVSIYNPNGHHFLPGLHGPPKDDDDAHIYDYIEDTLVYGHLLRDGEEMDQHGAPATGTYQPFTGPTDGKPPTQPGGQEDSEVGVYRPFIPPDATAPPASKMDAAQEGPNSYEGQKMAENNKLYTGDGVRAGCPPEPLSPCSEALQAPVL